MAEGSLTKAALVEEVAHVAGLTKKRAEIIVRHRISATSRRRCTMAKRLNSAGFGSLRLGDSTHP